MNKEVNLSITTLKVEIKVLVLDGKRFTKSVFDQLPTDWDYQEGNTPKMIGFVSQNYRNTAVYNWADDAYIAIRWALFVRDGVLYKKHEDSLSDILKLTLRALPESSQIFISI